MPLNIPKEVAALQKLTIGQLRERYAQVHAEPTRSNHREFLIRRILWRLQAVEEGDLTERARRRAAEIADDCDIRLRPPAPRPANPRPLRLAAPNDVVIGGIRAFPNDGMPMPGALLTRQYRGKRIVVRVLPKGFEFEGEVFRSLSAIARQVTGAHWNGRAFFNLKPATGTAKAEAS